MRQSKRVEPKSQSNRDPGPAARIPMGRVGPTSTHSPDSLNQGKVNLLSFTKPAPHPITCHWKYLRGQWKER